MVHLPQDVIDQIAEIRAGRRTTLDLANLKLDRIPEGVFELPTVEDLILHTNNISEVPERLRQLPRLRRVDLSFNRLHGILADLDLFAAYRVTSDSLLDRLRDLNALTLEQHQKNQFGELAKALETAG